MPAVILMLVPDAAREDDRHLLAEAMFYGASPIAEESLKTAQAIFKGCGFTQLYGLTETVGAGTALQPEDHVGDRCCAPAASPIRASTSKSSTPTTSDVKTGEVGEIVIRGGDGDEGLLEQARTATRSRRASFSGEKRWFYTGDAGFFDKDGFLFIHDRVKDMIVSGGENIYPAEVENAIFGHPAVADVAVIGVPDDKWGEAVKAIVVLKPGMQATAEDIIAFTRTRIAGYKVPKSVDFVESAAAQPRRQDPAPRTPRAVLGRQRAAGELGAPLQRSRPGAEPASRAHLLEREGRRH